MTSTFIKGVKKVVAYNDGIAEELIARGSMKVKWPESEDEEEIQFCKTNPSTSKKIPLDTWRDHSRSTFAYIPPYHYLDEKDYGISLTEKADIITELLPGSTWAHCFKDNCFFIFFENAEEKEKIMKQRGRYKIGHNIYFLQERRKRPPQQQSTPPPTYAQVTRRSGTPTAPKSDDLTEKQIEKIKEIVTSTVKETMEKHKEENDNKLSRIEHSVALLMKHLIPQDPPEEEDIDMIITKRSRKTSPRQSNSPPSKLSTTQKERRVRAPPRTKITTSHSPRH